jgi:hypothetical protein
VKKLAGWLKKLRNPFPYKKNMHTHFHDSENTIRHFKNMRECLKYVLSQYLNGELHKKKGMIKTLSLERAVDTIYANATVANWE